MRKYFYDYPICPVCHSPFNESAVTEINDNFNERFPSIEKNYNFPIYKCLKCGSYFKSFVDFSKFKFSNSLVKNYNIEENFFPLLWNINLNKLEQSYIDWIDFEKNSIYWITWPWKTVNFLPVLISEYAFKFSKYKIIVLVDETFIESEKDIIFKPTLSEILDNMNYYDHTGTIPKDLLKDMNKFGLKDIIVKTKKAHCHLKSLFKGNDPFDFMFDYSDFDFDLTHEKLFKFFNEKFGEKNYIQSIKLNGDKRFCQNVDKPFFDANIQLISSWGSKNIAFDKLGYFNIINNYNNAKKLKDSLSYMYVEDSEEVDLTKQVYIIDYNNKALFKLVKKINPDTIIFPNFDKVFSDYKSTYGKYNRRGRRFIGLLHNKNYCFILFSTNRDFRFVIDELNINPKKLFKHTWDSNEILNSVNDNRNRFNYIFSSNFDSIQKVQMPNVEYKCINEMEIIENHIFEINNQLKECPNHRYYRRFFNTLKTSLLNVLDSEYYSNFIFDGEYTLRKIIDEISELGVLGEDEDEVYDNLMKPFKEIYRNDDESFNPLRYNIIKCCKDILQEDDSNHIKIISYNKQKKLLSKLIDLSQFNNHVEILTWNELNKVDEENLTVISTIYPNFNYNLYNENILRYIFIGGPNYISYIRDIVDKRVLEKINRPISRVNDNHAPKLLINTLNKFSHTLDELQDIIYEIDLFDENNFHKSKNELELENDNQKTFEKKYIYNIKKGSEAFLLIDENNKAIFYPLNHRITVKEDRGFDYIELKTKNLRKIIGKNLFIRNQFYKSHKELFVKFMAENSDNFRFKFDENHICNGFKEFIDANYRWIYNLRTFLSILDNRVNISNSKLTLSYKLRNNTDLSIGGEYIEKIWLAEPILVPTIIGDIEIYPIDRPKNLETLEKTYESLSIEKNKLNENEKKIVNSLDLSKEAAFFDFNCSVMYQNFRLDFLHGHVKPEFRYLYEKFLLELNDMINSSDLFKITENSKKIKLKEDVAAFKIINDYEKYV